MCFEIVLPVYHSIQNVIFNKNFQAKLLIIQIVLTFIALQDYIIMFFFHIHIQRICIKMVLSCIVGKKNYLMISSFQIWAYYWNVQDSSDWHIRISQLGAVFSIFSIGKFVNFGILLWILTRTSQLLNTLKWFLISTKLYILIVKNSTTIFVSVKFQCFHVSLTTSIKNL